MSGWLDGDVALITGGGSGIGAAVAQRFVTEGASVVIFGRDFSRLEEVRTSSAAPSRIHTVAGDVLAYELAPKVRVNGIACGLLRTDLRGPAALALNERSIAASFDRRPADAPPPPIPLHDSSIEPADFTGPYVLLASRSQSGTITGQAIQADGGIGVRGFASAAGGDHL